MIEDGISGFFLEFRNKGFDFSHRTENKMTELKSYILEIGFDRYSEIQLTMYLYCQSKKNECEKSQNESVKSQKELQLWTYFQRK